MLSTTWVYGQFRRAEEQYQQHLKIYDRLYEDLSECRKKIARLEQENAELKAKYLLIHQRQFKANKKAKEQQYTEKTKKGVKKRGAPVGHQGWFRKKPERIDRVVYVEAPTHCPYCDDDDLVVLSETTEHIQEDMAPPPPPITTKYVHGLAWCKRCGKAVSQTGEGEISGAHIGPLAKATAIYLRQEIGISYRKVQLMIKDLFGLFFVPASALGFDRKATANGLPIYKDIREKIRVSDVVHADETSWRNDGVGHYAWYAGNDDLAFFHLDRYRSAAVAQSIFGSNFNGVLVRDRYAAYNKIGRDWQACLAHISRNAKDIDKEHALLPQSKQDPGVNTFATEIRELCSLLCETSKKISAGKLSQKTTTALEKESSRKLNRICKQNLKFRPAEALRKFLAGSEQKHLFTFLRYPNVAPTNNQAEQTLRRLVIFRKICFGTRSQSGLEVHSVLPSLVLTAKRQGVDPLLFLKILLTKNTAIAQATLFNDSS